MPDFLNPDITPKTAVHALDVVGRLLLASALGWVVSWIYRRTRKSTDVVASFPTTLVLLSALIAVVTQVIGESVARAFSLVGALSIVRFRTVVRDTQDTAYVIFAVAIGMAVGAQASIVALAGILVVGVTAFLMATRESVVDGAKPLYVLSIRVGLGQNLDSLQKVLGPFVQGSDLLSIETAKQGAALDVSYEIRIKHEVSPNDIVRGLNQVEGVQSVELQKRSEEG